MNHNFSFIFENHIAMTIKDSNEYGKYLRSVRPALPVWPLSTAMTYTRTTRTHAFFVFCHKIFPKTYCIIYIK